MIQTRRKEMIEMLEEGARSLKELADHFGVDVRDITKDLYHISQTVKSQHKKFKRKWAECNSCGFVFKDRQKFTRPTKCPRCKSEDITEPVFSIG